ncbi:class II glutamine amidotransferase [Paramicrobacterium agarici]|uniref:Putative glutamine amidotransferase n=1 Tax=Paramicrobacterium agarici TaxID=630514 RepID=A0A2A9DUY6_9MICO|nr:class II glutamine amidotransferase [Microbacterium agarici]PFG29802.1 putative glutamine amidotransferase [Microbacterium agarici]
MCRLFGYVSAAPTAVVDELGEEAFDEFTALTRVHGDGWGMAWHDADGSTKTARSPLAADVDPEYARLAAQPLGTAGIVHLRWATGGLPVSPENTHPFVDGNFAFGHNGHVGPMDRLEALLTPESLEKLRGDTDSERYFRLIMQCIDETGDEAEGVSKALRMLMSEFPNDSLNALLLTPAHLFAVHVNSRADSPKEGLRALFESPDAIPARHENEYYAMDYQATDSCMQVISSGVDTQGWTPVPPDTAAMIDIETRELTRLELLPA